MKNKPCHRAIQRALKEAEYRHMKKKQYRSSEKGGREGPEPTRYGDWENKGIVTDF